MFNRRQVSRLLELRALTKEKAKALMKGTEERERARKGQETPAPTPSNPEAV